MTHKANQTEDDLAKQGPSETAPLPFRRYGALVSAAIVLTIIAGVVHGRLTDRWRQSAVLEDAGALLQQFPEEFGPWRMSGSTELSQKVENTLMCSGYLNRKYVNRLTGESVNLAVLVGPPGPMSVHTPEICFSSKRFDIREERREVSVHTGQEFDESFWTVGFRSRDVRANGIQVYYAWNSGNGWRATDNPRFGFAAAPYLYKLQMAVTASPEEMKQKQQPGVSFLQEFLPVLEHFLIAQETGAKEDDAPRETHF